MKPILAITAAVMTALSVHLLLRAPPLVAPQTTAAFLARLDADGSGAVSPEEYRRASDGVVDFALFDTNDSGALEPWELEQVLLRVSPDTPQPTLLPRVR